jgi:hypothetical protein
MAADPSVKLRKLLTEVLTPQATNVSRADAAEAAAVRLAKRMLASESTFKIAGFACDEEWYGAGQASYLTNAQGLVGVLLPLVEVDWARPDAVELEKIIKAAKDVVNQANRENVSTEVWFGLLPYVGDGPIRKAFPGQQVKDFYSTTGVSWVLSSLILLYLCHLNGKVELTGDAFEVEDVITGIEATYGLLLKSYKKSSGRAGWGWCSLVASPDLYHTWSVSQTLGDMEDYVFTPSKTAGYASDPGLDKLRRKLQEATPANFLHGGAKSPTESIYRDACQWLYSELTATASQAIKEEISDDNSPENDIYYTFFLVETLVYMHADELLPPLLNVSRETVLNTLYEKLFVGSNRLGSLRDTAWYGSAEQSTLSVPLPLPPGNPVGDKMKDPLLEPSLEPLVLRALSYGPVYLKKRDILDFVEVAVLRHASVLDEKVDLWDDKGANFLICERTVEALFMIRNMFRNTSEIAIAPPVGVGVTTPERRAAGFTLTLSSDQVSGLVDTVTSRVMDRVRPQIEELFKRQMPLVTVAAPSNAGDILSIVDPVGYKDIAKPDKILRYLDEPGAPSEATLYQTMLLETVVTLLAGALRSSRPAAASGGDESLSQKLADGFAYAVASTLPRALAYFLSDLIERLPDDDDVLKDKFDRARIEQQVNRLALAYIQKEFKLGQPFDLAKGMSEALDRLDRLPGGSK